MSATFLSQLIAAGDTPRQESLLLEQSLSRLDAEARRITWAAAIPHWFTEEFLAALCGSTAVAAEAFRKLTSLSFIEMFAELGFSVHERVRRPMLEELWRLDRSGFVELSRRAYLFCQSQDQSQPVWRIELIYHCLTADPGEGSSLFAEQINRWKDEGHDDRVEMLARSGIEVVEGRRVPSDIAERVELAYASLGLIYGKSEAPRSSDQAIADRFLAGERQGVATIDQWIARAAWPYQRRLGDRFDDVLQDIRLEVTRLFKKHEFRGGTSLKTYLWRLVQHRCLDQIRREGRWRWTDLMEESEEPKSVMRRYIDLEVQSVQAQEARDLVLKVWGNMPADCRELWGMMAAGLTYAEMAQRKGVSEGTTRIRMLRCREKAAQLRTELAAADWGKDEGSGPQG